jgi:hypothetical protein
MEERQAPAWHERWTPVTQEPAHPLAALEGQPLAGAELRVLLGPSSRFGARYFALLLADAEGRATREPVLSGLHHQGPLPSYNWIEVAETKQRVQLPDATAIDIGDDGIEQLFELLYALIPPGGHLMVEYDSPQRAETAQALAHGVPPIATPLGELLFRVGFAAHFKDWQIAEGGSEGPRKLQAYKPPSPDDARRWAQRAADQLRAFLAGPPPSSPIVQAAQERAQALLPSLASDD